MKVFIATHPLYAEAIDHFIKIANSAQKQFLFEAIQLSFDEEKTIDKLELTEEDADNVLHELFELKKKRKYKKHDLLIVLFDGKILDAKGRDPFYIWMNATKDKTDIGTALFSTYYIENNKFNLKNGDKTDFIWRYIALGIVYALTDMYTDLEYHYITTGCIMDFCENIKDILLQIKNPFSFCKKQGCLQKLQDSERGKTILQISEALNKNPFKSNESFRMIPRCFKINVAGCVKSSVVVPNRVFIGMPFKSFFQDIFDFGIKPALEHSGFSYWKADEHPKNIDMMCKVCENIQSSEYAVVDLSEYNPNVYFELGLCYGLGRTVVIIKNEDSDTPTDLKGMEYISYKGAKELENKLKLDIPRIFI